MNFQFMPSFPGAHGYPLAILLMIISAILPYAISSARAGCRFCRPQQVRIARREKPYSKAFKGAFPRNKELFRMIDRWQKVPWWFIFLNRFRAMVAGQSIPTAKPYNDCIVRYAASTVAGKPDHSAAGLFYKYRYGKGESLMLGWIPSTGNWPRLPPRLSATAFSNKIPEAHPGVPATQIRTTASKIPRNRAEPISK